MIRRDQSVKGERMKKKDGRMTERKKEKDHEDGGMRDKGERGIIG